MARSTPQSLGDAEVLVEDDDDDSVVLSVADGAQVAPAAGTGLSQRLDLQALSAGKQHIPPRLAEAPARAAVVRGDDRLGDVTDRVVLVRMMPRTRS